MIFVNLRVMSLGSSKSHYNSDGPIPHMSRVEVSGDYPKQGIAIKKI